MEQLSSVEVNWSFGAFADEVGPDKLEGKLRFSRDCVVVLRKLLRPQVKAPTDKKTEHVSLNIHSRHIDLVPRNN
jgi:hypothetical protein